ncbi:uncharacterized protein LOC134814637 isoform X1 [Bolinopsis microptera]|uniref:uncharacterized protein LOC134814637 isoform X1 n=1 Tax=Bolinopsis microptera TaxID=2820187 RepID=UPI00307989EA
MSQDNPPTSCFSCTRFTNTLSRLVRRNSIKPYETDTSDKHNVNGTTVLKVYQNEAALKMEKSELEEQFRIVDLNKDGFIDAEELKMVMKNLGMKHSDEEISLMMQHADINGSGKIEEDDFMKVMSDYLDSEKEETLDVRDLFDFFDSDKDGFISQQELQFAIKEVLQDSISANEIETMMKLACKKARKSKDAMISFRDFQLLLEDVGFTA